MAEVFRAESEGLQGFRKQVAIKRVLPHLSEKKKFISMFLDEARLSAQLSHSNCVQVFDIGVGDNAYFIVMEFVDGANLKSISASMTKHGTDFPVAAAAWIVHEICKGLTYAHELTDSNGSPLQIVHRDVSPPNVLISKFGEVKIVDFGLAKASSQLEKSDAGIIKGKFSYLSPEAAMGQEVDRRTDIFAVGIILWELLAGQRLFLGDTDFQTVKKVQAAQVPPISQINPKVPAELERIVHRALAKDTLKRYATAREFGQDLVHFMFKFGQPISSFDIAQIVESTIRDKQRVRPPQNSIIDKLIEEALLEFTSLKEDDPVGAHNFLSDALFSPMSSSAQFVAPTNWADVIGFAETKKPGFDPLRASFPAEAFEQGNLAALEDAEPALSSSNIAPEVADAFAPTMPPPSTEKDEDAPASAEVSANSESQDADASTAASSSSKSPGKAESKGGLSKATLGVLIVVAVVTISAAMGAWLTNLIH